MLTLSVIAGLLAYGVTDDGSAIAVATATVFLLTGAVFLLRVWLSSSSAVKPKEPGTRLASISGREHIGRLGLAGALMREH